MITILKSNPFLIVLGSLLLLFSCDDKSDFNLYKSIDNEGWKANEKIFFEFDVKDTISPKNLFINIRNNNEYAYSNLYLITELVFPNETKVVDTLQYEMADKTGRFLGVGFTEIKENKLFYKEKKAFPISGNYTFNVRHAMRKNGEVKPIEFLKGIQDVGFSIEN
ncbi:gliding motility lipoprotein GldH [Polaribacter sp. R2A056_3_33]|jgi:gliding motility-associated lipoprotein GldH|uniref:gliding motility lipoprotein GldH n=1 Tax=Polaribacter sp. R2A056_3_33 TaxID=2745563 RepID=UPI001C4F6840|nr:gliding motility lipoprotein GldH [Polaribacter sp. R2A056_3_33]QXP71479.1 gliding motility lipoprotein GldH [Polaribacter sp. R2A056_3_33]